MWKLVTAAACACVMLGCMCCERRGAGVAVGGWVVRWARWGPGKASAPWKAARWAADDGAGDGIKGAGGFPTGCAEKFSCVEAVATLGIEPRAFRVRSGCDTTAPCARGGS